MSYIKELDKQIRDYLIQELVNPERCVLHYQEDDPKAWDDAWRVWEDWMESHWRHVATAHAGKAITDSELHARYGLWRERQTEPGATLLRLINKDKERVTAKFEDDLARSKLFGGH